MAPKPDPDSLTCFEYKQERLPKPILVYYLYITGSIYTQGFYSY